MNYNDANDGREAESSWATQQENSDYNSDFSMPSDDDGEDHEYDEKSDETRRRHKVCFRGLVCHHPSVRFSLK